MMCQSLVVVIDGHSYNNRGSFQVCSWWASLLGVIAHWLLGEDDQAETLFSTLESIPEHLKTSEDPLPTAVLYAVK